MTREPVQLTLYYREGCHLCAAMLQALRGLQSRLDFVVSLEDIDRDPQLRRRYDEWVPVLCCDGRELCHYHLDIQAVADACAPPAGPDRSDRLSTGREA